MPQQGACIIPASWTSSQVVWWWKWGRDQMWEIFL